MAISNIVTWTTEALDEFVIKFKDWVKNSIPRNTSELKNDSGFITSADVPTMDGATEDTDGSSGLVPAPAVADVNKFLKGDGTWTEVDAEPDEYLKTASVSENQLTITPNQGDPITFTGGVPADWTATESEAGYIQNVPDVLRDQVQQIVFDPDTMETDDSVEGKVTISVKPISAFSGATADADGTSGMVPAPTAADAGKYLRGDGTWVTPDGGSGGSTVTSTYDSTTETLRIKIG